MVGGEKQTKIEEFIFTGNDINWQSMLVDLVHDENMDIWDIDISKISSKYLEMIKNLKDLNFQVCGKIILAAAILLKLKSERFISGDINSFDSLMMDDQGWDELDDFFVDAKQELREDLKELKKQKPIVVPRSPQPRKRKVSIYDLIGALEQALETNARKPLKKPKEKFKVPEKKIDISQVIKDVYSKVLDYFEMETEIQLENSHVKFSSLLPEEASSFDKIYTFVPLLHLTNDRKVNLHQEEHFGEIEVELITKKTETDAQA